jgi:branched-chain amino acid transport system substrate-binding protein
VNRTVRQLTAAALGVGLLAAACGSDDEGGGADDTTDVTEAFDEAQDIMEVVREDPLAGTEGSGLDRGVSDGSVRIGCVVDATSHPGFEDGLRARFQRANDEGGIHGREIELLACQDTGGDPQQNLSLVQELVEQEQVFGMITLDATMGQASFDYLNENEVPYTGWGFLPGYCGTRWGFGWNGCLAGQALADAVPHAVYQTNLSEAVIAAADLEAEGLTVAIQSEDATSGQIAMDQYASLFEAAGGEIVYSEANMPTSGVTDYTPFVQGAMQAQPDMVVLSLNFTNSGGMAAGLQAAGYEGVVLDFTSYVPGLLDSSPQLAEALEGVYTNSQVVPSEQETPYVEMIGDDLEASGAENGRFVTLPGAIAYAQANLLVTLIEAAGEDLDTQTFDQAVNGEGVTVEAGAEGGVGTLTYPQHHFLPADCAAVVQVEDGAYTVAEEFRCYESQRIR